MCFSLMLKTNNLAYNVNKKFLAFDNNIFLGGSEDFTP